MQNGRQERCFFQITLPRNVIAVKKESTFRWHCKVTEEVVVFPFFL